jgi:hypothetical protein
MTDGEFVVIGTSNGEGGPPVALLARQRTSGLVYAGSAFVTLAAPARDASGAESLRSLPRSPRSLGLRTGRRHGAGRRCASERGIYAGVAG